MEDREVGPVEAVQRSGSAEEREFATEEVEEAATEV